MFDPTRKPSDSEGWLVWTSIDFCYRAVPGVLNTYAEWVHEGEEDQYYLRFVDAVLTGVCRQGIC